MKREYSQLEIEKILKEDAQIPSVVEESMERHMKITKGQSLMNK